MQIAQAADPHDGRNGNARRGDGAIQEGFLLKIGPHVIVEAQDVLLPIGGKREGLRDLAPFHDVEVGDWRVELLTQ